MCHLMTSWSHMRKWLLVTRCLPMTNCPLVTLMSSHDQVSSNDMLWQVVTPDVILNGKVWLRDIDLITLNLQDNELWWSRHLYTDVHHVYRQTPWVVSITEHPPGTRASVPPWHTYVCNSWPWMRPPRSLTSGASAVCRSINVHVCSCRAIRDSIESKEIHFSVSRYQAPSTDSVPYIHYTTPSSERGAFSSILPRRAGAHVELLLAPTEVWTCLAWHTWRKYLFFPRYRRSVTRSAGIEPVDANWRNFDTNARRIAAAADDIAAASPRRMIRLRRCKIITSSSLRRVLSSSRYRDTMLSTDAKSWPS